MGDDKDEVKRVQMDEFVEMVNQFTALKDDHLEALKQIEELQRLVPLRPGEVRCTCIKRVKENFPKAGTCPYCGGKIPGRN